MCFDSHQDQVYHLIQLAVTRLLFTAVTWLKRKQSHHMLLESSDKSQVGLKFPLFLAVFILSPGNQVLGSRLSSSSLSSKEPATKFNCNQQSPQYWNVQHWWIDSGLPVDRLVRNPWKTTWQGRGAGWAQAYDGRAQFKADSAPPLQSFKRPASQKPWQGTVILLSILMFYTCLTPTERFTVTSRGRFPWLLQKKGEKSL